VSPSDVPGAPPGGREPGGREPGGFIAPIFPTGLSWLYKVVPDAHRAGAFVMAMALVGGVAFPPLICVAYQGVGVTAIPLLLFALNAVCLATVARLRVVRPT
jgi:fucose permease